MVSCPCPRPGRTARAPHGQFSRPIRSRQKNRSIQPRLSREFLLATVSSRGLRSLSVGASTSSDPTAVARKILRAELALRPRTRRESAAICRWAARPCRGGLRTRADWIEHWARAQPPSCRVSDALARPGALALRLGRAGALLPANAGCTRREDYETRRDTPRIAPHERTSPRRSYRMVRRLALLAVGARRSSRPSRRARGGRR